MWSLWNTTIRTTHPIKASSSETFVFAEKWFRDNAIDQTIQADGESKTIRTRGGSTFWSFFAFFGSEHSLWHETTYAFADSAQGCEMTCIIHFKMCGVIFGKNTLVDERDSFLKEARYSLGTGAERQ